MSDRKNPSPNSIALILDLLELNGLDREDPNTTAFGLTLLTLVLGWARMIKQPMTDDEDPPDVDPHRSTGCPHS